MRAIQSTCQTPTTTAFSDPAELVVNAKDLPQLEFVDYTFVLN
jgi:hypothetical protein